MSSSIQHIVQLLKKDIAIEWRQKSTIAAMLVYVLATVFVLYLSFEGSIEAAVWMAIYWIVLLFVVINLTVNAFTEEANRQFYYLRSLASAAAIIAAKMLYNSIYFVVLSTLTLGALSLFFGFPVVDMYRFFLVVILGAIGLSNTFTLLSAITARIKNISLIAVLGFPIILPLLLISIRLSGKTLDSFFAIGFNKEIGILIALNVLIITLAMILFTYLWRD